MNFEAHFRASLKKQFPDSKEPAQKLLKRSLLHSLLAKASRFRPQLCLAVTKVLKQNPKRILPYAVAIEMIHTASLIHDDLPSMDNAKIRRGKKCNHLVFGEDIALLAGSCLFVESWRLLNSPLYCEKRSELLNLLIGKAGFQGLMSGQALDLRFGASSKQKLFKMMRLKTGSLIEASVLGPLILWGKTKKIKKALSAYSRHLGLAYQLADDLKDRDGFAKFRKTMVQELKSATEKSLKALKPLGERSEELKQLALWNQSHGLNGLKR